MSATSEDESKQKPGPYRLAVLLGVSRYVSNTDLPAVRSDVENMRRLLNSLAKDTDIVVLDGDRDASTVKRELRDYIDRCATEPEEIFFYFSGHGFLNGDEPLYCLSDFAEETKRSTALSNTEIDEMFRGLRPRLYVKLVDACHAGQRYIKSAPQIKSGAVGFDKVIAWYSSHPDQTSWLHDGGSLFTNAIIEGALRQSSRIDDSVYYREIQSFVADKLETEGLKQQPLFIDQVMGSERMGYVTQAFLDFQTDFLARPPAQPVPIGSERDEAIIQIEAELAKMDELYFTEDSAADTLAASRRALEEHKAADEFVRHFYDASLSFDNERFVPDRSIAKWASTGSETIFAQVHYRRATRQVLRPKKRARSAIQHQLAMMGLADEEMVEVSEDYQVPDQLEIRESQLPYIQVEAVYTSSHASLADHKIAFVLVPGPTVVHVHYRTIASAIVSWQEYRFHKTAELHSVAHRWLDIQADPKCWWSGPIAALERTLADEIKGLLKHRRPNEPAEEG